MPGASREEAHDVKVTLPQAILSIQGYTELLEVAHKMLEINSRVGSFASGQLSKGVLAGGALRAAIA